MTYYDNNKDKIRSQQKEYYQRTRETKLVKANKYFKEHFTDEYREKKKKYLNHYRILKTELSLNSHILLA